MEERTKESTPLKRLPLDALHREAGAKMVPFVGYEMPLKYQSVQAEWRAVREQCGLFDVSHMGKFFVHGHASLHLLQKLLTNNAGKLARGRVQYSLLCAPDGGIIDDLTVYRLTSVRFMLVVNGATKDMDFEWIRSHAVPQATCDDATERFALFALQGPASAKVLEALGLGDVVSSLRYYAFCGAQIHGIYALIARLGYTGEDGFELRVEIKNDGHTIVWNALREAGAPFGLTLCGLAGRDILRLEAGMPLYGKDLNRNCSPLEAGLGRFVAFDKSDFVGKDALLKQRAQGLAQRLVGFTRGIPALTPEQSAIVQPAGNKKRIAGVVTSSVISPRYGGIGMAYVSTNVTPGTDVSIITKKNRVPALISALPFYNNKRGAK